MRIIPGRIVIIVCVIVFAVLMSLAEPPAPKQPPAPPTIDWEKEMQRPEAQQAITDFIRVHCQFDEAPFRPAGQPMRVIPMCFVYPPVTK